MGTLIVLSLFIWFIYWLIQQDIKERKEKEQRLRQEEEIRHRYEEEKKKRRIEEEERERIRIVNLRAELKQFLLEMPVLIDITGIELCTLHEDEDDWRDVYATDSLCRDLRLVDLVERLVLFWDYRGERGPRFSQDRKMTCANKVQTFSLTYYGTYERYMYREIHILRIGPENFKAMKVPKSRYKNYR